MYSDISADIKAGFMCKQKSKQHSFCCLKLID